MILPLCSGNAQSREERSFLNLTSFCRALPSVGHQSPFPVLGWWDAGVLWDQQCTWSQVFHPKLSLQLIGFGPGSLRASLHAISRLGSFLFPSFFSLKWKHDHLPLCAKSLQSCPSLWDPMDCNPPGSSAHGIPQARKWSGLPFPPPGNSPDPGGPIRISCLLHWLLGSLPLVPTICCFMICFNFF